MTTKRITLIFGLVGLVISAALPAWAQVCTPPPSDIVSWWPGEGDATDLIDGNTGTPMGAATFVPSFIGQGFKFGGIPSDQVTLGNPTNLQVQTFTIEAWASRSATTVSSLNATTGCVLCYGANGYGFGLFDDGRLFLSRIGVNVVDSGSRRVTDLNFHHVAVTKSDNTVIFYVDGVGTTAPPYDPGFTFTTSVAIGGRGDQVNSGLLGIADEVSVYNRALTTAEIQQIFNAGSAGKCTP
jgi:hypothetical protein